MIKFLNLFFVLLYLSACSTPTRNVASTIVLYNDHNTREVFINEFERDNKVSILWWNTLGGGQLSHQIKKTEGISPLDENLKMIVNSDYSPDFIALGEFKESEFEKETLEVISKVYPHSLFVAYSKYQTNSGIKVFSKYPMTAETKQLDWTPITSKKEVKEEYRQNWIKHHRSKPNTFERPMIIIKAKIQEKEFVFIPIHLCNPWPLMRQSFKHAGTAKTALSLIYGTDNPLYYQTMRLQNHMNKSLISNKIPFILFGDMNTPNVVDPPGLTPNPFVNISKNMSYLMTENTQHSFPSASTQKHSDILPFVIDHAFSFPETNSKAKILPLRGSDHYPLLIMHELN